MLNTREFGKALQKEGFDFFSGVPCSYLKYLLNYAVNSSEYIAAVNEGEAVAACAGAWLGGKKPVFLGQNSGLTNASSPLISLNHPFGLPLLGFVGLRGEEGRGDEPQHQLMGAVTGSLLDLMAIEWELLADEPAAAEKQLARAVHCLEKGRSFFFLVRKGTFSPEEPAKKEPPLPPPGEKKTQNRPDTRPFRREALRVLSNWKDRDTLLLTTTGYTGRELYELEDAPNNFYMTGSMGCVGALALGLALAQKGKRVVAVDGDGALLMRLGTLAVNSCYAPGNMLHLLLDNGVYESTGGQYTAGRRVNFVDLAAAAGYPRTVYLHDVEELAEELDLWREKKELTFLYLRIQPGTKENLPRPEKGPMELRERFCRFVRGGGDER